MLAPPLHLPLHRNLAGSGISLVPSRWSIWGGSKVAPDGIRPDNFVLPSLFLFNLSFLLCLWYCKRSQQTPAAGGCSGLTPAPSSQGMAAGENGRNWELGILATCLNTV